MRYMLNESIPSSDEFCFYPLKPKHDKPALVIHNPPNAVCESPLLPRSQKSLDQHITFIEDNDIGNAVIVSEDISFLKRCPSLECLWIIAPNNSSILELSPLNSLPNLHWLRINLPTGNKKYTLNFECSTQLEYLSLSGQNYRITKINTSKLRTLYLSGIDARGQGFDFLEPNCMLENMVITNSNMDSMNGIDRCSALKRLELLHNRSLMDISKISELRDSLIWLDIESCGKIRDFSILSELTKLQLLRLSGSNALPSLEFIKNMPNLKYLVIMTDVIDGDFSSCSNIPYVAIKNRKHFSRKNNDFSKRILFPTYITEYE